MTEETVEPQTEEIVDAVEQTSIESNENDSESSESRTQVPLSALQKERRRRQELEQELNWERKRQMAQQAPVEEDNSRYESATKEDLSKTQRESIRIIEEKMWIKANPEKFEKINEHLTEFLKQRPNLTGAIESASNRYEEAYTLMEALTPKQQKQLKTVAPPKKDAPNAPSSMPKATAMNQAVDFGSMSDEEFGKWKRSQIKRR